MKNLCKSICVLFLLFTVYSCDYLDVVPDNVITEDFVFQDRYTAERFLATCYCGLPKESNRNENPSLLGAMEMITNKDCNDKAMLFARGLDSPSTAYINYWNGSNSLYWSINDCNTFLSGIGRVQDLLPEEKDRMIAEVKMLKVLMHFYLLCYYGPITPLKENYPIDLSTDAAHIEREILDDTFRYLLEEVQSIIDNKSLPLIIDNRVSELGRFTLPAAYMLKAKILLYWASPLFNGNKDYAGFKNEEGICFFNQVYDETRWANAAQACKEAIEICKTANIRLYQMDDYHNVRDMSVENKRLLSLRGIISDVWNPELIWGNTPNNVGSSLQSSAFTFLEPLTQASWDVDMNLSVPLHIVESFYSENGVPINEDKLYNYEGRYNLKNGDEKHQYYIMLGEQTAVLNFNREPRFYASLGFDRGVWFGNSYKGYNESSPLCIKGRAGEVANRLTYNQYNVTGYFPKKLVSINTTFKNAHSVQYVAYPFPNMRYADLLLMYAEALNESKEQPDDIVYNAIDEVRKRAGLGGVVECWRQYSIYPDLPKTKEGMRSIIQRERMIELAFEGSYFWDTRRWKTALLNQNRIIQGWNVNGEVAEEYYIPMTVYVQTFSLKNYFAPIPESDIIKNPNLIQNPGW